MSGRPYARAHTRTHDVDWPRLARDLYAACAQRHTTMRAAGDHMGVDTTELAKLRRGAPLSAALASLIAWLYPNNTPEWIKVRGHTEARS